MCVEIQKIHELNIPLINMKPSNFVFDDNNNLYLCDYCQYFTFK